jgi:CheY-like chemotaxis protein
MVVDNEKTHGQLNKNLVFLVVDDFETMRRVTVNQLRQLGAEKILTAKDGAEALRILKSQLVHMVLADWNMPVMTGLELLKAVRADEKLFTLPFLMITAETERHKVEEAIASGVTSLVVKPYSANQLRMRLESAFVWKPKKIATPPPATVVVKVGAAPAPVPLTLPVREPRHEVKPTILIVDDTPDNLMLLSHLFKTEYRVRLAQNGAKAVEICTSDNPPDMVLLDIMMPDMDGFEVAKRMREHPNSESIPVIFVTAMTSMDARMKGMDLGAVDFITKPVDPELLIPRVRNFMRYVEMRKDLQSDYDNMVQVAQLHDVVDHIMRHDLKGPMAGIIGLTQSLLADPALGRNHLETLRLIEETALTTLNMVNLSSELFKIESGQFKLHAEPVRIADILRRTIELSRSTFSEKNIAISLETDVPDGAEMPQVLGDPMLCYSLFQNLVKNACEAAPNDTKVIVKLFDQNPLRVLIQNRGAVPAEIRERFFDKYVTAGKAGGTGLGTYSAKLMTEAQGGTIELTVSDEANATSISLKLPRA